MDLPVFADSFSTSTVSAAAPFFVLVAPPRMSSHWLTMVRSTGEMGELGDDFSLCLAREMMDLSMPDLEDVAVAPPPRVATTDGAEEAVLGEEAPEKSKSACLPVETKKRVENAMARLTNFFLNCSLFDILFPRILFETLLNVDRTLPRIDGPLLFALLLVIDNIVVVDDNVGESCIQGARVVPW